MSSINPSPWFDPRMKKIEEIAAEDPAKAYLMADPLARQEATGGGEIPAPSDGAPMMDFSFKHVSMGPMKRTPQSDIELEMESLSKKLMDDRLAKINSREQELKGLGQAPSGVMAADLSPLMGLVDSWTGSKMAGSYNGPVAAKQYQQQKAALEAALDKERGGLTDDQLKMLQLKSTERSRLDAAEARREANALMAQMRGQKMGISEDNLISRQYAAFDNDKIITKYKTQQDNVVRGYHTLTNPPGGIVTNGMLKEITNEIAQALAAGAASAESDREKAEFRTAYQTMAQWQQYITGAPQHAATPEIAQHIKEQLERIHEAFSQNIASRAQQIAAGRQFGSQSVNEAVKRKASETVNMANTPLHKAAGGHAPAPQAPAGLMSPDEWEKLNGGQ